MTGTYVVCLDCGEEFPYDWQAMAIVRSPKKRGDHGAVIEMSTAEGRAADRKCLAAVHRRKSRTSE